MNIVQRFQQAYRAIVGSSTNLKNPAYWLMKKMGFSAAGVSVTKESSLSIPTVWACVRVNSHAVGSVPFEVMKRDANGIRPATEHYLYQLLNAEPSHLYTSASFRESMQSNLELDGNAYAQIHRNQGGRIAHFEILSPSTVEPYLDNGELYYKVQRNNNTADHLAAEDVIHITGLSCSGLKGKNPIEVLRESFGISLAAQKYGVKFFENGAHMKGAIKYPGQLTPEQSKMLKDQLQDEYSGLDNSSKTMLLEYGMEYQAIGIKPADALFIETKNFSVAEIARIYGTAPHLIGHETGGTQLNLEQLNINYTTFTIYPRVKKWEQEFKRKTLTENDRKNGYFIRFNLNGLMRGDIKARAEYYLKMRQILAFSPNDVLKLESMNTYEGGDDHFLPLASNLKIEENETETDN